MLQCIAIDDEPMALEVIKSLSAKVPFVSLNAVFTNAFDALTYLQKIQVDLIFLDIKMPDISGIEWLKAIADPPMIVFTTAYSEHAVESFELNAIDYLLKPFSLARFLKASTKARDLFQLKSGLQNVNNDHVFIKCGYEQVRVNLSDLIYVQSAGNYLHFVLSDTKLLTRLTMTEAEELLPASHFLRIHRSYLVAKSAIGRFDKNTVWVGNISLPVGAGYNESVNQLLR